ncbi:hypothetical protein F383_35955 [Gossypium arboreum]|uniref:Uncharacterized protein n=1 Tax=Gossypium arboreum TaxID=29729 RepID=A0A0B0N2Y9_GOSAR|nr:hypothetical protein F383_35955 [Gossypium arboreum]
MRSIKQRIKGNRAFVRVDISGLRPEGIRAS